jgi:ankyrin repeat protein
MGKCGADMVEINHLCRNIEDVKNIGDAKMLTLEEILSDAAALPAFKHHDVVKVDSRGKGGETPLHWMATLGDVAAIKILVSHGAFIDASDHDGNTPLHEAVLWRHTHAANILLELGANMFLKNKANLTPYDLAKTSGFEPMEKLFVKL